MRTRSSERDSANEIAPQRLKLPHAISLFPTETIWVGGTFTALVTMKKYGKVKEKASAKFKAPGKHTSPDVYFIS